MMDIRPLRSEADYDAALTAVLGSKARASEVLNRRRHLTLEQAWKLHVEWHIPTDALLRPYPLRPIT